MSGPLVVLMGPPGSGKTTVGRALSALTGAALRDTDHDIEETTGRSIPDIFAEDGEETFRALERQAVATALAEHPGILSLGGGAILAPETQALLNQYAENGGKVVFLDVSIAAAAPRVGFNQSRPLLLGNPRARWVELMKQRRPIYEALATLSVQTDDLTAAEVAEAIAKELGL